MMRTATTRDVPESSAIRIICGSVFSGRGNKKNKTRAKIRCMVPTGSRNDRRPGIRRDRRWLSTMLTTPEMAALSIAALVQFTSIATHFSALAYRDKESHDFGLS